MKCNNFDSPFFSPFKLTFTTISTKGIGIVQTSYFNNLKLFSNWLYKGISFSFAKPLHYEKVKALKNKWDSQDIASFGIPYEVILTRAEEIKRIYGKTHYCFIHAQSAMLTPIIYLTNMMCKSEDSFKFPFFKYIRTRIPKSSDGLEEAIADGKEGCDYYYHVRRNLLSADASYRHKWYKECAGYFLENNSSIHPETNDYALNSLYSYDKTKHLQRELILNKAEKISNICNSIGEELPCGNLLVICIPKTLVKKSPISHLFYRAHSFGRECKCHENKDEEILEKLQDDICDESIKCKQRRNPVPQYRLILPNLKPQDGVLLFLLTPFSKQQRQEIKKKVKEVLFE